MLAPPDSSFLQVFVLGRGSTLCKLCCQCRDFAALCSASPFEPGKKLYSAHILKELRPFPWTVYLWCHFVFLGGKLHGIVAVP